MEMENQDIKVEVVDQTQPLGIEFTLYTFKCRRCGRTFFAINNVNLVANQAKYHLKTHGVNIDSLVIGKRIVEV